MPLDSDSLKNLEDVKRGKARRFVMITKGEKILNLIVYKRGSLEKYRKDAKDEAGVGEFHYGVVDGKGMNISFKLCTADGFTEPPGKDIKLKTFLVDETGIKFKPKYEIVPLLPDVNESDDDTDADAGSSTLSAASGDPNAAAMAMEALNRLTPLIKRSLSAAPDRKEEILRPAAEIKQLIEDGEISSAQQEIVYYARDLKELSASWASVGESGKATKVYEASDEASEKYYRSSLRYAQEENDAAREDEQEQSGVESEGSNYSEQYQTEYYIRDLNFSKESILSPASGSNSSAAQNGKDAGSPSGSHYTRSILSEADSDDQIRPDTESIYTQPVEPATGSNAPPPRQLTPEEAYERTRMSTDTLLAGLARFVPDKLRRVLDKDFADATALSRDQTDEAYKAATKALFSLQKVLLKKTPELNKLENIHLRKQVQSTLDTEGDVLLKEDKKDFTRRFDVLDNDLPADRSVSSNQLDALRQLSKELNEAIRSRLNSISDLCVDYERLTLVVKRALSIKSDRHDELERARKEVEAGFSGGFVLDGLKVEEIRAKLAGLEGIVQEVFKNYSHKEAVKDQMRSLPASVDSLKLAGEPIAEGEFGAVYELDSDSDQKLVGKRPKSDDPKYQREMQREALTYAHIGDHPNIAKCYGIHEVEGSRMLVMEMIEGQNIDKVFDDLTKRYQDKKLSREQYLAATQHIFKGVLMGLAHLETMGLVHKDVHSGNVKFDPRTKQAVLIDMGLAQEIGTHKNRMMMTPIAPPEQFAKGPQDSVVTPLWDTFTVGKMLFEEMERDHSGERYMLITGSGALRKDDLTNKIMKDIPNASRRILERIGPNQFKEKIDNRGVPLGYALQPADYPAEAAEPGKYGAATTYVDFMNRLTHPNPKERMSASEALKHPFMTDTFLSGEELDSVFGAPSSQPKDGVEQEEVEVKAIFEAEAQRHEKDRDSTRTSSFSGASGNYAREVADDNGCEQKGDEADSDASEASESELDEDQGSPSGTHQDVAATIAQNTTALQRWQIATQQVEQQFNSAYSKVASSKAKLKAAGFTKGKKFSDYFTYNKGLDKLIKSFEEAKKKRSKELPKLSTKVMEATAHYRDKIIRKANTDYGWAKATPPVQPPFWKTLVAALDDVDKWVES